MKYMKLGQSDIDISKMGLGTWAIGGGPAWNGDVETQTAIDTVVKAVDLGINLIDTAPGYNFGNSEKIVGEALKHVDREKVVLVTKCGIVWDRKGALFNKVGDRQLYKNLSPESIREEIEQSLRRLDTDYIDISMTHWQAVEPYFTPIAETMEVLNQLKDEGKIRAIGAANVTKEHIEEYVKYGELDIVQGKYSVLDRAVEEDLVPVCLENNITLQAYSPLEQGLLSGTFPRDYVPTGAQCNKKWFQPENMQRAMDMMDAWKPLCDKYGCTIPSLALAWVMNQGDHITLLSGATTADQIAVNAEAAAVPLTDEDLKQMRDMATAIDRD